MFDKVYYKQYVRHKIRICLGQVKFFKNIPLDDVNVRTLGNIKASSYFIWFCDLTIIAVPSVIGSLFPGSIFPADMFLLSIFSGLDFESPSNFSKKTRKLDFEGITKFELK